MIVGFSFHLCQLSVSTSASFSADSEDLINVTSLPTFSPTLLSFLNLLTQRMHYVTEPFAPSSVVIFFFYTVETHNTWECALRQNWMENWTLIITDGELAYPNPYRAKPFPPPASFITARTLVHSTSGLPWDFCFTSCFLCYVPRNNGIQSWTLPLSKVGNCLGSPIRSSRAWAAMDFIRFKQWCYCCNSYISHNNLLAESPECKPGGNKHERGKCAALLVPVVEKVFRVILQNRN